MNQPPRTVIASLTPATLLAAALGGLLASSSLHAEDVSKLAGQWTWTWKNPIGETHRHRLDVEGIDSRLAAREQFDDEKPVKVEDLTFKEQKKVRFTVERDGRRAEYRGTLEGEAINGTVVVTADGQSAEFVWKATRAKAGGDKTP